VKLKSGASFQMDDAIAISCFYFLSFLSFIRLFRARKEEEDSYIQKTLYQVDECQTKVCRGSKLITPESLKRKENKTKTSAVQRSGAHEFIGIIHKFSTPIQIHVC